MFEDSTHTLLNWQCYAKRHNYTLFLDFLDESDPAAFFQRRWRIVRETLAKCATVMSFDGDTVIARLDFEFPRLLDGHSLVFSWRENHEVTAAVVIMRSDEFAVSFLDEWDNNIGTVDNFDNGALIWTLAARARLTCPRRPYESLIECLYSAVHGRMILQPQISIKELGVFWRSHECTLPPDPLSYCRDTDAMLHGCKKIGQRLVIPSEGCEQFTRRLKKCTYLTEP